VACEKDLAFMFGNRAKSLRNMGAYRYRCRLLGKRGAPCDGSK